MIRNFTLSLVVLVSAMPAFAGFNFGDATKQGGYGVSLYVPEKGPGEYNFHAHLGSNQMGMRDPFVSYFPITGENAIGVQLSLHGDSQTRPEQTPRIYAGMGVNLNGWRASMSSSTGFYDANDNLKGGALPDGDNTLLGAPLPSNYWSHANASFSFSATGVDYVSAYGTLVQDHYFEYWTGERVDYLSLSPMATIYFKDAAAATLAAENFGAIGATLVPEPGLAFGAIPVIGSLLMRRRR